MTEFWNEEGFFCRAYHGEEEVELPDLTDEVEVARYQESQMVRVFKKSKYKDSLRRDYEKTSTASVPDAPTRDFKDIAADTATSPPHFADKAFSAPLATGIDFADESIKGLDNGDVIDTRTGNKVGRCKSYETLRVTHRTQEDKVYASLHYRETLFVTVDLDGEVSFSRMRKCLDAFIKWTKRQDGFTFGAYFLEPCADGNWHCHFLLYWKTGIPDNADDRLRHWWEKYNERPSEHQVDIERVKDNNHLATLLAYLDPNSAEKKKRRKFYPLNVHIMGCFGAVRRGEHKIETFEEAKPSLGEEMTDFRSRFEKYHPETGELVSFTSAYLFEMRTLAEQSRSLPLANDTAEPQHFAEKPPEQQNITIEPTALRDWFVCDLTCGFSHYIDCSKCGHFGRCGDCLGAVCDNICTDCVRKISTNVVSTGIPDNTPKQVFH